MTLFWRRGYEATSMNDLSQALGVGPSSIYNTFGSKEALYQQAVTRYVECHGRVLRDALDHPDAVTALTGMLAAAPAAYTQADCPAGCAVLSAGRLDRPESAAVDGFLTGLRAATLGAVRQRVQRGVSDGQLAADTDVEGLSRALVGVIHGLSEQARDGATQEQLEGAAALAAGLVRGAATRTPS